MKNRMTSRIMAVLMTFMMMLQVALPTTTVFASDSNKGIEVKVDRTELDKAVKAAQDAGVPVTKDAEVDKGVAKSKSEIDAKIAEIKKDYGDQIQAINTEIQKKKDCTAKQQEYEKLKAKYDQDLAKYEEAKKKYDEDLKKYNADMAELEKHKDEDGYLSEPAAQPLNFKSEPDATVSVSNGNVYNKDEFDAQVKSWGYGPGNWGYAYFEQLNGGFPGTPHAFSQGDLRVILEQGKITTVTYSNLRNSSMNGVKIAKVVFEYTLKSTSPLQGKVPVVIKQDPTKTIWYTDFFGSTKIGVNVKFYDGNDEKINISDGLVSFSSLNKGHIPEIFSNWKDAIERVENYNGELIYITGSSVKIHGNSAYSDTNNQRTEEGSKYSGAEWDTDTSPLSWYGAVVGKGVGNSISFDISSNNCGNILFSFNSKIRALNVPEKPVEPKKPTPPKEPQCPVIQAKYHYDILFANAEVEKKVTDQAGNDINDKVVNTESVVKFELATSSFPAGHEKIDSLVFKDDLPEGYEVDLGATKAASPEYDVTQNGNTLTFTAKANLLGKINADLNVESKVPSAFIVGKVTKEGTTYENKFDLTINNNYKVESKPVKVHTHTKPKKEVFEEGKLTTSIDGKVVQPGQKLVYKVTYTNTTGKAQDVTITDKIPAHTKFVSADNGGTEQGGVITWKKSGVADKAKFEVIFTVQVDANVNGEVIKNKADVQDGVNKFTTNETHNPTGTQPKKDVFEEGKLTTSIDGKVVQPGQKLVYKVTYTNTTGKDQDVTITDKIPAHTKFVSADNGGTEQGGVITWKKSGVADKAKFEVTFTVQVDANVNGEVIKNKADVQDGVNKFTTNETHNPTGTQPKKDVFEEGKLTTSIDGKVVSAGEQLVYKVTYKNTTGEDRQVTITDKIPEHTTYVAGTATDNGQEANGTITWVKDVKKDASWTVMFTVKVDDNVNGEVIENTAKVNDGKNNYKTNDVHNPTGTQPKKDVFAKGKLDISIDGKTVKEGEELTYKVSYKNTTGKEQNVTITDKIPEHTTFVEADNGGQNNNGVITWKKDGVKDGESFEVTFTVKVNKVNGEVIKNKAKVLDGVNDSETNEVTNPTPTKPEKEVFIGNETTNIDGKAVKAGDELTYTITYKNTTGKEAQVTITDKIPAHTKFVSADNEGIEADGTITWKKTVAKGETLKVSFKVVVEEVNGEVLTNKAKVNDGENDYDTNEVTNPTPTKPEKEVFIGNETTNIDGKAVKAGDVLTYRIRYKNTTGKEQKVVITDMIPKHTEYVEKSVSEGGNYVNGVVIWTKENLAPGEVFEVSFKVKVKEVEREEMLRNEATVRADENDIRTNITENPVKPNDKPKSPKTGDNSNIMLSVSLLALATGVLVLMESKRRREYSDD